MKNFLIVVGGVVVILIAISIAAFIGGTLVYWMWPVAIPALFPRVVSGGWLAAHLTWWQSVLAVWILGLLIKSSSGSGGKKSN